MNQTSISKHTDNKAMEQTDLRIHRTPASLAFADHMNRFIAGDRAPSSPEGAEMPTGFDPPLDGAVVLHKHVVSNVAPADADNPQHERLRL